MPLVICHSPKGGVGTTFLAAHLAMSLSEVDGDDGLGTDVSLMTLSATDLTPLHFGLPPAQRLPTLDAPADAAVLAGGISLLSEPGAAADADFTVRLEEAGFLGGAEDRTLVIDVPAGQRRLARRLMPHATLHVCALTATPDCLALLPALLDEAGADGAARAAYVIGRLDETRKLARHVAAFAREVLGERLIGRVRNDQAVPEALAMLQLLSRYAPASAALADVRTIGTAVRAMLASGRQADSGSGADWQRESAADAGALAPLPPRGASRAA